MKSILFPVAAGLCSSLFSLATAADSTTDTSLPKSTDASSFLSDVWSGQGPTPTWATGKYATTLATALYSLETSFIMRSDYTSIVDAIWSAAEKDGGSDVVASLSASYWGWGAVTTNDWYTKNVPKALQTEVVNYDSAWDSAVTSVEAKATATKNAAAPRCTGMAIAGAGVAMGVAAFAGAM